MTDLDTIRQRNERAHVSLARCSGYGDKQRIRSAIENMLRPFGGLESFVAPGQSVLLKPNMLTDREPDRAVTTHPEVVRALIHMIRECGAEPSVGDSPANVTKIERVWERTGYRALCEEESVPLVNFEKGGSQRFSVDGVSFSIARPVVEADIVISVPKVKTHALTIFTGAVKNMYGTIPGFQKTCLHRDYPTPSEHGRLVAALYSKVMPDLAIADGIVGMEGEGPSGGRPVNIGILAASPSCVALDVVLCEILKIKLRAVPYLSLLAKMRPKEGNRRRIDVSGLTIEEAAPASFDAPGTLLGRLIPGWLLRILKPYLWIKPTFLDNCVACGRCVDACPVKALHIGDRNKPELDHAKCIECCCCHEVCPEDAVQMGLSPFLKFIRRGRLP